MSNYCVVIDMSTANHEFPMNTHIMVAVKNKKARWWERDVKKASDVVNNPGQHVFPGGDKAAKTEFQEETGVRLDDYEISKEEEVEIKDKVKNKTYTFSASYIWLDKKPFADVLKAAQDNLKDNRPDKMLTTDDELKSIDVRSFGVALELFKEEDEPTNDKKRTTWFTLICLDLEKRI